MENYKCNFCVSNYCVRMYQLNTKVIGINAGKIWEVLHQNQSLTQHQLMKETGLDDERFHQAIGWLARENKVHKESEFYSLSETNLTSTIGPVAGLVYSVLEDLKESVEGLEELTRLRSDEFNLAIGWLAREGHFQTSEDTQVVNTAPPSFDEQVQRLHGEIEDLSDEVVARNHIICELTRQLTETQTKYIRELDVIEQLNMKIQKNQPLISKEDGLSESVQKIQFLDEEVKHLHNELMSRNHIINELSRQLTNTQTTVITQADKLQRLQVAAGKTPPSASGSVSESLRKRVNRITQLQKSLDANPENMLISESKLYDVESPILDISRSQSVSEDELREALNLLHEDIDHMISQKKAVLNREDHS
jgi:predicted RNase H-like nuclease (RuvC/YqgF family)